MPGSNELASLLSIAKPISFSLSTNDFVLSLVVFETNLTANRVLNLFNASTAPGVGSDSTCKVLIIEEGGFGRL